MSQEILQIFGTLNQGEIKTQLALQCAPLLTGIKISNLLVVDKSNKKAVVKLFHGSEISLLVVYESDCKVTFLLYRKKELLGYLQRSRVREVMGQLGYGVHEMNLILREFSLRYRSYMTGQGTFPHEIGLLLGYPVEDVTGFMENEGRNYLYAGYWKVYGNLPETMELFDKFNQAREMVIRMISKGASIHHILELYGSHRYQTV